MTPRSTFLPLKRKIIRFTFCKQHPVLFDCESLHLALRVIWEFLKIFNDSTLSDTSVVKGEQCGESM